MMQLTLIENLREHYDFCAYAEQIGITFLEYQLLFRLKEGVRHSELLEVLYCSKATFYRLKQSVVKKIKANTFEQAMCIAVEHGLI